MQPQTRQWSRSLDEAFTIRLPFDPAVLLIHSFSGDPTKTFIQFDPSDSLSRQRIKNNGKWKWEEERIVYVVNTEAQAGKSLVILMGPKGTDIEGGTPAFQVESTSGATIDPATEGKQDDAITELTALKTRLGEVDADPTENTVLERLKVLETQLSALNDKHKNQGSLAHGQVTVGTSAVQLNADQAVPDGFGVVIKAGQANTGQVYVGLTGLSTSTGFELSAKESITLYVSNLNLVYMIASASAQKISYIVEKAA